MALIIAKSRSLCLYHQHNQLIAPLPVTHPMPALVKRVFHRWSVCIIADIGLWNIPLAISGSTHTTYTTRSRSIEIFSVYNYLVKIICRGGKLL